MAEDYTFGEGELSPAEEITGREVARVEPSRAVTVQPFKGLIKLAAPVAEIVQHYAEVREYIAAALKPERDYGVIPGTKKATLLKPGAESVCGAFNITPRFRIIEQEVDHDRPTHWVKRTWHWGERKGEKVYETEEGDALGLYRYVVGCELVHRETGAIIGTGIGSCSSLESKFVDRPRDVENTILKMAKKRAHIDATLTAFGLSDQFTQDVEDGAPAEAGAEGEREQLPTCPVCHGAMYDNRKANDERAEKGERLWPDFKCRKKPACEGGQYWRGEWPPASAEQVLELSVLCIELAAYVDDDMPQRTYKKLETCSQMVKLGVNQPASHVAKAIEWLEKLKASKQPAPSDTDTEIAPPLAVPANEPADADPFSQDDDLPF